MITSVAYSSSSGLHYSCYSGLPLLSVADKHGIASLVGMQLQLRRWVHGLLLLVCFSHHNRYSDNIILCRASVNNG